MSNPTSTIATTVAAMPAGEASSLALIEAGEGRIGSIADRVIKGAECPCLVFNPFKKTWRYTTETGTKK